MRKPQSSGHVPDDRVYEQTREDQTLSIARVTEITASSTTSFDDAVRQGLARAAQTLDNVKGAWIQDQEVRADGGNVTEYRVHMKVTFVLNEGDD